MSNGEGIGGLIERSRLAQKRYESFGQAEVDAIVRAIAKIVYDNAEALARLAVDETGMGVYEDKVKKNQGKARIIWNSLKGKKSVGVLRADPLTGVTEVAKPMGVVGAVTPCTNPIVTPMCNAMFALKGRNSIIIAPHPRATRCAAEVVGLINEAIGRLGAPAGLVQTVGRPTVELTNELMRAVDVVIATGGAGMVKAAYSSGKPAYGVGAGNVQCIVDRDADLADAVPKIVAGRIFDNGIICSGEQTIIVHEDDYPRLISELRKNGAFIVDDGEGRRRLREAVFPGGAMNKDLVGQPVQRVAQAAGLTLPEGAKLIAVKAEAACPAEVTGAGDVLCKEKMCPVIALFPYKTFGQALEIARANLDAEGRGHSVSIHSNNSANIEAAAGALPVSRVLVNQVCATMNGGSFHNGFTPTTTLGCGTWGNNSISENLGYWHLLNVTRIGRYMKDAPVPSDDEIWGLG